MGKLIKAEDVLPVLLKTAKMICAEQPDMPEPKTLQDLDSFSFVQVIIEMENICQYKILEGLEDFEGDTFEDLAEFIAGCEPADYQLPTSGDTPAAESAPAPAPVESAPAATVPAATVPAATVPAATVPAATVPASAPAETGAVKVETA